MSVSPPIISFHDVKFWCCSLHRTLLKKKMVCVSRTLKIMNKIGVQENPSHHFKRVVKTKDSVEVTLAVRALRATPPPGNQHALIGAGRTVRRKKRKKKNGSTLVVDNLQKSTPIEATLIPRRFRPSSDQSRFG